MDDYRFERLNSINLCNLKTLYLHCFGADINIDYLIKKYNTEAFGKVNIGFLAFHSSGEVAAYYGVFPIIAQYNNEKLLIAQSGDTMTHPTHQGKRLFTTLAKKTYDLAKEEGIHFVFGLPNKNSYPGFINKLSWSHYDTMINYKIKVKTIPLSELAKRIKIIKPLYKLYQSFVLSFYKTNSYFSNSVIQPNIGGVVHDKTFLDYKTYSDNNFILIYGIKVWIKVEGFLFIGDVEHFDITLRNAFWNKLKLLSTILGCTTIFISTTKGSFIDKICSGKTPIEGLPVGFINLSGVYPAENFKYTFADFDTF